MQLGLQVKLQEEVMVHQEARVLWVRREPQEPQEQLETLDRVDLMECVDHQERLDGLASRVQQECKGLLDRQARQE